MYLNNTSSIVLRGVTENLIAFNDISPVSTEHMLIIPKDHIRNINSPQLTIELV